MKYIFWNFFSLSKMRNQTITPKRTETWWLTSQKRKRWQGKIFSEPGRANGSGTSCTKSSTALMLSSRSWMSEIHLEQDAQWSKITSKRRRHTSIWYLNEKNIIFNRHLKLLQVFPLTENIILSSRKAAFCSSRQTRNQPYFQVRTI